MPDQQEKTSSDGAKMYDPSNLAKGEIYDLINQIIHDAAAAWQFIDQGDPEEALPVLHSIHEHRNEIEVILEDCRIAPTKEVA